MRSRGRTTTRQCAAIRMMMRGVERQHSGNVTSASRPALRGHEGIELDCYHEKSGGELSTTAAVPAPPNVTEEQRRRAVLTVVACTLIGAAGQVLIKIGGANLQHAGLIATAIGILTIPTLFAGYVLYGIFAALMVYALRHGELSLLYPIIALTYVWVTILSVLVFHETITPLKGIGIAIIVCGVAVLGRGGSR